MTGPARVADAKRSTLAPATSAVADHPSTIAMNRGNAALDPPAGRLAPFATMPLAPEAMAVPPDSPPPRRVA